MRVRPKILFLTSGWPRPVIGGAQQRTAEISGLLGRVGDVSFAIITSRAADAETVRLNMSEFNVRMTASALSTAHWSLFGRLNWRIRHELDPRYPVTEARSINEGDRSALLDLVREHDLVWVQDVKTASCCGIDRWPHSVLDTVDIMSDLYRTKAKVQPDRVRALLDMRLSWLWKRRERYFTERFNALTVCSESDRVLLGGKPQIHVLPNGFSPQPLRSLPFPAIPRIGFIGTFDWPPNQDGVEWFAHRVWPVVKRELPRVQLRIIGRNTACASMLGPNIAGLGWLEDPGEEIATWSAMIVPIRFGAGTRVKMAEGFARKCPIVATLTGAHGYGVRDGEECLLADDSRDFASACVRLVRDPQLGRELAERAHQRFLREWTWDAQEAKVRAVVRECLAASSSPAEVNPSPRAAGGRIHSLNV